ELGLLGLATLSTEPPFRSRHGERHQAETEEKQIEPGRERPSLTRQWCELAHGEQEPRRAERQPEPVTRRDRRGSYRCGSGTGWGRLEKLPQPLPPVPGFATGFGPVDRELPHLVDHRSFE